MKRYILFTAFIFLFIPDYSFSQLKDSKYYQDQISALKDEIGLLAKRRSEEEQKVQNASNELKYIEKEIYLRKRLLRNLTSGIRTLEGDIRKTRKEIEDLNVELEKGRELLSKRIILLYKYNRFNEVEAVLMSNSLNQFFKGVKYFKLVADVDKKRFSEFENKIKKLNEKTRSLEKSLNDKKDLADQKTVEEKRLNTRRKGRESVLNKAKSQIKNIDFLIKREKDREEELFALFKRASSLESRSATEEDLEEFKGTFPKTKGKMDWPVIGRISGKFGRVVNPKHKTVTRNLGIDIKAEMNTYVRAVSGGIVSTVTWVPSFGSMILIKHADKYITGYSHLSDILVEPNQRVDAGDIIGRVGDDSSLDGPKLTFFISKDGENFLNPEDWLKK
ncbi:murein hydrolase activator EnvC family protein [candidate division KSB1 bacterium]